MSKVSSQIAPSGDSVGLIIKDQTCSADVFEGAFVYLDGTTFKNAIATGITTSRVIGIVEFKSDTTTCDIRIGGLTDEVFSGLVANTNYFLSSTVAGTVSTSVVTGSGNVLMKIGRPVTDKILLIGIELRTIRA